MLRTPIVDLAFGEPDQYNSPLTGITSAALQHASTLRWMSYLSLKIVVDTPVTGNLVPNLVTTTRYMTSNIPVDPIDTVMSLGVFIKSNIRLTK